MIGPWAVWNRVLNKDRSGMGGLLRNESYLNHKLSAHRSGCTLYNILSKNIQKGFKAWRTHNQQLTIHDFLWFGSLGMPRWWFMLQGGSWDIFWSFLRKRRILHTEIWQTWLLGSTWQHPHNSDRHPWICAFFHMPLKWRPSCRQGQNLPFWW